MKRRDATGGGANLHVEEIAPDLGPRPARTPLTGGPMTVDDVDGADDVTVEPRSVHGCVVHESCGQDVVHPTREQYVELVQRLADDGYVMCVDVTAVDYLRFMQRSVPDGIQPERFEVVVNLLDLANRRRVRLRVQVPETDPIVPTLFDIHPGTEAMEREVFDMFGIVFTDHPDPSRHPDARGLGRPSAPQGLRDRRDPGAVQGRNIVTRRSPTREPRSSGRRSELTAKELLREVGAVLRMSEAEAAQLGAAQIDVDTGLDTGLDSGLDAGLDSGQTMIINMGPQHPSTHGVLRLMLELQRRDSAALQADHRLPAHRHGEDRREAHVHAGRHERDAHGLREPDHQRAGVLDGDREAARHRRRHPRAGDVDADAAQRAQPDGQPPVVHGDQRHRPRRGVDDDLRLARARGGPALLPEGHRAADEPQLRPSRRGRGRPAGRLARRRAPHPRHRAGTSRRVRHVADRPAASGASDCRASA